ncbi:hypothetical protein HMPREF1566_0588 [Providencia alcalifaciens PAL-1]|nr:hypothetical protein HMPREF1566_0588 [Providencia alcalifaciens PAL-1]
MKPVGLPWYTSAINFRKFYVTIFAKFFISIYSFLLDNLANITSN